MNIKQHFTTVTPLSKIVAAATFIAMPFLGLYLGMQYQTALDSITSNQVVLVREPKPQQHPVYCGQEQLTCWDGSSVGRVEPDCLFAECPEDVKPSFLTDDEKGSSIHSSDKTLLAYIKPVTNGKTTTVQIHVYNETTQNDRIINNNADLFGGYDWPWMNACGIRYFSLDNKHIIVDCGTGPQRIVTVLNATNGKRVTSFSTTQYNFMPKENIITFQEATNEKVTPQNCPNYQTYVAAHGIGAKVEDLQEYASIVANYSFELSTHIKKEVKELGGRQCVYVM